MNQDFALLLFAGDINLYSVARAFHEQYNIKPYAVGKYPGGPCFESEIINYTSNISIDREQTLMAYLSRFAKENSDKKVLVIGCGDNYVQILSQNLDKMPKNVIAPYINYDLMSRLINKERFYEICDKYGLDYPETFICRKDTDLNFNLPFDGPFILKPSNGIEYFDNPFIGQKKVYKIKTREKLNQTIKKIYESGYQDTLIVQDLIPGDDTNMRVMTCYSDQRGEVKLMCLGHVLLEEHTPKGIGNHAVVITENNQELEKKVKVLLESLNYVGFSNFDIKYDERDGKYKFFELNPRQGRSNYYVTATGANISQYVVEDYVYNHPIDFRVVDEEILWTVVPKSVAFKYIKQPLYKEKMKKLIKGGKMTNPLFYKKDRKLKRAFKLLKNQVGHHIKYKKYMNDLK